LRHFSSAGYIVNKTRSPLDPNIVNIFLCLRDWCQCRWHRSYNFQHINNFELTGDPFKLVKLYNLRALL